MEAPDWPKERPSVKVWELRCVSSYRSWYVCLELWRRSGTSGDWDTSSLKPDLYTRIRGYAWGRSANRCGWTCIMERLSWHYQGNGRERTRHSTLCNRKEMLLNSWLSFDYAWWTTMGIRTPTKPMERCFQSSKPCSRTRIRQLEQHREQSAAMVAQMEYDWTQCNLNW